MAAYLRSIFRGRDYPKSDNRDTSGSTSPHSGSQSRSQSGSSTTNKSRFPEGSYNESHRPGPIQTTFSRRNNPFTSNDRPGSPLRTTHDTDSLRRTSPQDEYPPTMLAHRYRKHSLDHSSGTLSSLASAQTVGERSLQKHTVNATNPLRQIYASNHPTTTTHPMQRPSPSRNSSSGSVATQKSVLKSTSGHTVDALKQSRPNAHVSFQNPNRPTPIHMHPLLSYGRIHRAPISYNIIFPPSSRTVVDRHTYSAIPSFTLTQPATEPPTYERIFLKADKLPWNIEVTTGRDSPIPRSVSRGSGKRFYIDSGSTTSIGTPKAISILDVLGAIHTTLSARVTQAEWDSLGNGSRTQRKATRAYEKRCTDTGGGWGSGVRRLDYLGGKTRLVGIEVVMEKAPGGESTPIGKLVFSRP